LEQGWRKKPWLGKVFWIEGTHTKSILESANHPAKKRNQGA